MDYDFICFEGFLKSDGTILRDVHRKILDPQRFRNLCLKNDIMVKSNETIEAYNLAVKHLFQEKEKPEDSPIEITKEEAKYRLKNTKELFEGFLARGSYGGDLVIYYTISENNTICLGFANDITARSLHATMNSNKALAPILEKWHRIVTPYAKTLSINLGDLGDVVNAVWTKCFSGPDTMEFEEIDFSAPPAIIEGFGKGSEYTIPFIKKHSTLDDLDPILKDFLIRVEDHEYLCAIIASHLIGFKKHYIPWIFGRGGEGKSTFTKFLGKLVPKGSVDIQLESAYSLWDALGKTFLIFGDTSKKNLMYYEEIKKISGGDPIAINGKYKQPRTVVLPGLIIATSNKMPAVSVDQAIRRRARVFKTSTRTSKKELDIEKASEAMLNSSNSFLNYALQCLEKLGDITTGEVAEHPSNFDNTDEKTSIELEFKDAMQKSKLVFDSKLQISGFELRNMMNAQGKGKTENFISYFTEHIQKNCEVKYKDDIFYGIGKVITKHVTEVDREARILTLMGGSK